MFIKKMLAVVVSDFEIESQHQFERRMFGQQPRQLRSLVEWLQQQEARKVGQKMESTAQYWRPVWETLNGTGSRYARSGRRTPDIGTLHLAHAYPSGGGGARRISGRRTAW